jgi:hypothetical protein
MNVRHSLVAALAVLIAAPLAAQTPVQRSAEDAEFLKDAHLAAAAGIDRPQRGEAEVHRGCLARKDPG